MTFHLNVVSPIESDGLIVQLSLMATSAMWHARGFRGYDVFQAFPLRLVFEVKENTWATVPE